MIEVVVSVVSANVDCTMNNVKNVGDQSDQHYHMFKSSEILCCAKRQIVLKISKQFICRVKQSKTTACVR